MKLTLVAFYGDKPAGLAALIDDLQQRLLSCAGAAYVPYARQQVHATIIGWEGRRDHDRLWNDNFRQLRGEHHEMDFIGALALLKSTPLLPLAIQLGGFSLARRYPFTSRDQHPGLRSLQIQGEQVVMMGWPRAGQSYPDSLDVLRRAFIDHGILHKYHRAPEDIDNDFYLVLGQITGSALLADGQLSTMVDGMRNELAARRPVSVTLGHENLHLVRYRDPTLPPAGCQSYPLEQAQLNIEQIIAHHDA